MGRNVPAALPCTGILQEGWALLGTFWVEINPSISRGGTVIAQDLFHPFLWLWSLERPIRSHSRALFL